MMTFTHNPARDMVWSVFSDAENGDWLGGLGYLGADDRGV